jgi:AraC-like DNA-binding protein
MDHRGKTYDTGPHSDRSQCQRCCLRLAASELRWSLERMNQELRAQRPGGLLVAQHLAHMMLIQAIRLHLESGFLDGVGWLFALADKQLSAAMHAMHGDPARHWTLQMLAERAGMSRTIFASRFKETVGSPVMVYLSRWRMLLAGDKLRNSHASVAAIALELGYESESAMARSSREERLATAPAISLRRQ